MSDLKLSDYMNTDSLKHKLEEIQIEKLFCSKSETVEFLIKHYNEHKIKEVAQ